MKQNNLTKLGRLSMAGAVLASLGTTSVQTLMNTHAETAVNMSAQSTQKEINVSHTDPKTVADKIAGTNTYYPTGVAQNDLNRTVVRTINFVNTDGQAVHEPVKQTMQLYRDATINTKTGAVTYTKWTTDKVFDDIKIPQVEGYGSYGTNTYLNEKLTDGNNNPFLTKANIETAENQGIQQDYDVTIVYHRYSKDTDEKDSDISNVKPKPGDPIKLKPGQSGGDVTWVGPEQGGKITGLDAPEIIFTLPKAHRPAGAHHSKHPGLDLPDSGNSNSGKSQNDKSDTSNMSSATDTPSTPDKPTKQVQVNPEPDKSSEVSDVSNTTSSTDLNKIKPHIEQPELNKIKPHEQPALKPLKPGQSGGDITWIGPEEGGASHIISDTTTHVSVVHRPDGLNQHHDQSINTPSTPEPTTPDTSNPAPIATPHISIKYVDDTTDQTLKEDNNSHTDGKIGEAIQFSTNPETVIKDYESKGYELVSNDFKAGTILEKDPVTREYTVHLKHATTNVERTKDVHENITYKITNKDGKVTTEQAQNTPILHFKQAGVKDMVTGQTNWNGKIDAQIFTEIQVPKKQGFVSDVQTIPAKQVTITGANWDQNHDINVTINYKPEKQIEQGTQNQETPAQQNKRTSEDTSVFKQGITAQKDNTLPEMAENKDSVVAAGIGVASLVSLAGLAGTQIKKREGQD